MKLTFIGTGSAFTVGENYQSNMLFRADSGKNLLIDCGGDARHALFALGLSADDIDAVYISHLHADHVGGLEWLAFSTMFSQKMPRKVDLYCHKSLLRGLWNSLQGGLESLQDVQTQLSSYFTVHALEDEGSFLWEGVTFSIFRTTHQISNQTIMPSFGIEAVINGVKVLLTTDTVFPSDANQVLFQKYLWADVIFQDCETAAVKTHVHAHYSELNQLPAEIKKKMCLYHYQPGLLPNAKIDGFRCFIKKAQTFTFT